MKHLLYHVGLFAIAAMAQTEERRLGNVLILDVNPIDDIKIKVNKPNPFVFNSEVPVLAKSDENLGATVYGGYQKTDGLGLDEDGAPWQASLQGLRMRWDVAGGVVGGTHSGLFLFKKEDFTTAFSGMASVDLSTTSKVVAIFEEDLRTNLNIGMFENPTVRFVFKNALEYVISKPVDVKKKRVELRPTELEYNEYNPFVNDGDDAGLIGNPEVPSFNGITYLGFRLDVTRGENKVAKGGYGVARMKFFASSDPVSPTPAPFARGNGQVKLVSFTTDDIKTQVFRAKAFTFSETVPLIDDPKSEVAIYGAFQEDTVTNTQWIAGNEEWKGLGLYWGFNAGSANGFGLSGLWMFKTQKAFITNRSRVRFTVAFKNGDTLVDEVGRFVLKDSSGYHISGPISLKEDQSDSFKPRNLGYNSFNPFKNEDLAGVIGDTSSPTFNEVIWVGFQLDANRANLVANVPSANFGITAFEVEGKLAMETPSPTKSPTFQADPIQKRAVDWNIFDLSSMKSKSDPFPFDNTPELSASNVYYRGQPVFSAYQETESQGSSWRADPNQGLVIHWNQNQGTTGSEASALFVFKKQFFENGLDESTKNVRFDSKSIIVGTVNDISMADNSNSPINSASVRIVIRDNLGYFISDIIFPGTPGSDFMKNPLDLSYKTYDPFAANNDMVGKVGPEGVPNFNDIDAVGFLVEASRGNPAKATNYGLKQFLVEATNS